ncbi:hypothetical protein [Streptomyces wuyuanensis]|uniref:hypothetical protein n=1 Tax=Streptomyces wuyuanensis TaxID=1196353 RepID=UPI003413077C
MARKVIELKTCDPCAVKGEDTEAVDKLTIGGDEYDMCGTHLERFRAEFRKLFAAASNVKNIA